MFLICFLGGYQKDVLSFWPFYYYKMFFFVSSNKYCHKVYFVLLRLWPSRSGVCWIFFGYFVSPYGHLISFSFIPNYYLPPQGPVNLKHCLWLCLTNTHWKKELCTWAPSQVKYRQPVKWGLPVNLGVYQIGWVDNKSLGLRLWKSSGSILLHTSLAVARFALGMQIVFRANL